MITEAPIATATEAGSSASRFLAKLFPNYPDEIVLRHDVKLHSENKRPEGTFETFHPSDTAPIDAYAAAAPVDVLAYPLERVYHPACLAFSFEPHESTPDAIIAVTGHPSVLAEAKDGRKSLVYLIDGDQKEIDDLWQDLSERYPELGSEVPVPGRSFSLSPGSEFQRFTVGEVRGAILKPQEGKEAGPTRIWEDAEVYGEISPEILSKEVWFATAKSAKAPEWTTKSTTVGKFLERFVRHVARNEKDGRAIVPGSLVGKARNALEVARLDWQFVDVDNGASFLETFRRVQEEKLCCIA